MTKGLSLGKSAELGWLSGERVAFYLSLDALLDGKEQAAGDVVKAPMTWDLESSATLIGSKKAQ